MSFKEEHPNYKEYKSEQFYYSDVPYSFNWSELESLVEEAGGKEREPLAKIVQIIAKITRAGTISGWPSYDAIDFVVSKIRERVKEGKFYVLMDCLGILCDDGELSIETLNEFLEDYSIGYRASSGAWLSGISWEKIEDEDYEDSDISVDNSVVTPTLSDNMSISSPEGIVNKKRGTKMNNKPTKIFITHSAKDSEYVLLITELLRRLRVPNNCIVCTSDHIHTIPNGENAYKWLRKQFVESNLHMIFVLSKNYYESIPSLNEMGAAWLVSTKSDLLLLPGFCFSDLKKESGCLDKDIQGCSFESDDTMIKRWLNNLRDDVIFEFNLEKPDEIEWEGFRDSFIKEVKKLAHINGTDGRNMSQDNNSSFYEDTSNPVVKAIVEAGGEVQGYNTVAELLGISVTSAKRKIQQAIDEGLIIAVGSNVNKVFRLKSQNESIVFNKTDAVQISVESALLLVYAATDDGRIIREETLSPYIKVYTSHKKFMSEVNERESARWEEALDMLIYLGYVKEVGDQESIYTLTRTGYDKADHLKDIMNINTDNEPLDEMKRLEGWRNET